MTTTNRPDLFVGLSIGEVNDFAGMISFDFGCETMILDALDDMCEAG